LMPWFRVTFRLRLDDEVTGLTRELATMF